MLTGPGLQWWSRQGLARPKHGAGRTTETSSRASGTAANAARRLHQSCLARSHPSDNWLARNSTKRPQLEQLMQQLKAALRLGVTRAPNSRKLCDLRILKLERVGRRWADRGKAVGLAAWAPTSLAGVVHQSPTAIVACRPTTFLANGTFGPRETNRGMCLEPWFCQSKTNERWPYQTCYDCESDAQVWARPMLSAEKRHQTPSGKAATKEASGAAGLASELSRRGQPRRKRWVNGGGAFSNKADRTTTQSPHGCPHGANAVLCPPPGGSGETKQAHSRPKAQRPEDPSLFQYQMAGCAVQSYRAGCAPLARASCHPSKAPT